MRFPQSLWIMLKLMRSDDSAAEKSFTGIDTRPNATCAVAMALGIDHSLNGGRPIIVQSTGRERNRYRRTARCRGMGTTLADEGRSWPATASVPRPEAVSI